MRKTASKEGVIRINEHTARGYERVFGLSREELSKSPQMDSDTPSAWNRVVVPLSDEEVLILRLTAMRYGVDGHSILRMSTVLFMIVAELQLKDRKKCLADAEAKIHDFPDGLDHLEEMLNGKGNIQQALWTEKNAIEARDITGATFSDYEWYEHFTGNPNLFEAFLQRMLNELVPDVYEDDWGSLTSGLFQEQIEELTQGDALAEMVLLKNDVHPRELADIPREERVAFLRARCSEATRAAHEQRVSMLKKLDLYDL